MPVKQPFLYSCASLMVLSACAVGPDYKAPELTLQQNFTDRGDTFKPEQNESAWWNTFQDADLNRLIQESQTSGFDVASALARLNQSRALRHDAEFALLPSVKSNLSYDDRRVSGLQFQGAPNAPKNTKIYNAGFDATWEIDLFGRVRRKIEVSEAEEEIAHANLQDVVRTIAAEVGRNYFELRGAQYQLTVAKRNLELQGKTLSLVELKAKGGESSDLDVARARAQYNTTQAIIPALEANVDVAIHRLSVLVGKEPTALRTELSAEKELPNYQGPISIGDPTSMIRNRPDVRGVERRLAAATAEIGVATADLFPKVVFNGSIGMEAEHVPGLWNGNGDRHSFGPSISWALFDLGHVQARIKVSDARAQEALAEYQKAVLGALEDVENGLVRYSSEQTRHSSLATAADESKRAAQLSEALYRAGEADFLSVLDAERVQVQAEGELARSKTQLYVNLIALYKALGGGWQEVALVEKGK